MRSSDLEREVPSCNGNDVNRRDAEYAEKDKNFYTERMEAKRTTGRKKKRFASAFQADGMAKANSITPA